VQHSGVLLGGQTTTERQCKAKHQAKLWKTKEHNDNSDNQRKPMKNNGNECKSKETAENKGETVKSQGKLKNTIENAWK